MREIRWKMEPTTQQQLNNVILNDVIPDTILKRDTRIIDHYKEQMKLYAPCECGSGKKFKFCCKGKPKPETVVSLETPSFTFMKAPESAGAVHVYDSKPEPMFEVQTGNNNDNQSN